LSPIVWDNPQVTDPKEAILSAVAGSQVIADTLLRSRCVPIVAVIQDGLLDVAEDRLNRIIVWAPLG
jgi:hypothetical protein